MPTAIRDSQELERLMAALARDLVNASIHYRLHKALMEAVPEYVDELNEARAFWSLTMQAHLDACLHRLCRAYDQNGRALHLLGWLRTIEANLHLFEVAHFKERLRGNPFVDSLAEDTRTPDSIQLAQDMEFCSAKNPLVKRLMLLRNNALAHQSEDGAAQGRDWLKELNLKYEEIEDLLEGGVKILNRYSSLFKALSYSTQIVGHDDYKEVLLSIRNDLKSKRAEIEREIEEDLKAESTVRLRSKPPFSGS